MVSSEFAYVDESVRTFYVTFIVCYSGNYILSGNVSRFLLFSYSEKPVLL